MIFKSLQIVLRHSHVLLILYPTLSRSVGIIMWQIDVVTFRYLRLSQACAVVQYRVKDDLAFLWEHAIFDPPYNVNPSLINIKLCRVDCLVDILKVSCLVRINRLKRRVYIIRKCLLGGFGAYKCLLGISLPKTPIFQAADNSYVGKSS